MLKNIVTITVGVGLGFFLSRVAEIWLSVFLMEMVLN